MNLFNPSRWEGTVVDADGDFAPGYRMFSAVVAEPAQTAVLRVGLSMDAWETVVTQKPDQAGSAGFNRLDHPWPVLFEEAEVGATPDQTQVTLETTIVAWEAYGKLAPRLLAVTSDGREHTTPYAKGNWESGRTIIFDLPLSSVKEVQFQVSPYDWVEFRNISLKPRQKTVPTVVALGESASAKK